MKTPALMVLGTGSHAGKSALAAALCRIFHRQGRRVAPFKAQNMSLNAAATAGGEIGRAQAVQAAACGLEPSVEMNPILLKPAGNGYCQVIVRGQPRRASSSAEYGRYSPDILATVRDCYRQLAAQADLMILEGAGSPAEINLLDRDFANMWMAEEADARCLLVADIERGGAFAALYGTWRLAPHRERIGGFAFNKFRGEAALLAPGVEELQRLTGVATLGVIPHREPRLPEEDSLALAAGRGPDAAGALRIGVVRLPHIANFTDFEPLADEAGVTVEYVWEAAALGGCDVIILPGTRSTMSDLTALRECGLETPLRQAAAAGKPLLGICGGYQMLGETIRDPEGVESAQPRLEGLRLLPVETLFAAGKRVARERGRLRGTEIEVEGYWIQHGRVRRTGGEDWLEMEGGSEGCTVGPVRGTSLHGLFEAAGFRAWMLARWRAEARRPSLPGAAPRAAETLEARLDGWADFVSRHLDIGALATLAGLGGGRA